MTIIRIRSYHLDGYGHVNNARYLEFLEEARWAFFERHNLLELLGGIKMVFARVDIQYRRPAQAGHQLSIKTRVDTVLPRRVILVQTIARTDNGKTVAEDTKGYKTKEYILKRKLFKYNYPDIDFKEL